MKKQQKINHWKNIFELQQNSGLTIIQFCRDKKVNSSTFYAWRKRLSGEAYSAKPQQVIPLVIHEQLFIQPSNFHIKLLSDPSEVYPRGQWNETRDEPCCM